MSPKCPGFPGASPNAVTRYRTGHRFLLTLVATKIAPFFGWEVEETVVGLMNKNNVLYPPQRVIQSPPEALGSGVSTWRSWDDGSSPSNGASPPGPIVLRHTLLLCHAGEKGSGFARMDQESADLRWEPGNQPPPRGAALGPPGPRSEAREVKKGIGMNICVTNLSRETSEDALRYAFSAFGQVRLVSIVADEATGGLKALVSMPIEHEARAAIGAMNGANLGGQIVQAVGQAGTNILRIRDTPVVSRGVRGPAGRGGRGQAGRDVRGRAGRDGRGKGGRDGRGHAHRGKRRKS